MFTSDEWTVRKSEAADFYHVIDKNGNEMAIVMFSEQRANLIAAAPELLQLLKKNTVLITETFKLVKLGPIDRQVVDEFIAQNNAIVTKAEGGYKP